MVDVVGSYVGTKTENVYGIGSGPIWLKHVQCREDKKSIDECLHKGWGANSSCTYRDDVAISCSKGIYSLFVLANLASELMFNSYAQFSQWQFSDTTQISWKLLMRHIPQNC